MKKSHWIIAIACAVAVGIGLLTAEAKIFSFAHSVYSMRQNFRTDLERGKQFPAALAQAKVNGIATRMADLQKPLPPASQNAAPLYAQLDSMLRGNPLPPSKSPILNANIGHRRTQNEWDNLSRTLAAHQPALRSAQQAAQRPACVFSRNWTTPNPIDVKFPHLTAMRNAVRLLTAQSLLLAHQGKVTAAIQNQALGFQIGRQATGDGTLIAYLVGDAADAITLAGLKEILLMAPPNASTARQVQAVIAKDWHSRSMKPALRTEATFALGFVAYLRKAGPNGLDFDDSASSQPPTHINEVIWNEQLDYTGWLILTQMNRLIPIADAPYTTVKPITDQTEAVICDKSHATNTVAAFVWPMSAWILKRDILQAMVNVDLAGAYALGIVAKTGHPPASLPASFTDPYTGKPLGYRREGATGFVVFSRGESGKFDGDAPTPKDICFRSPESPAKVP